MMCGGITRDRGLLELNVSNGTRLIRQAMWKVRRRKYIQRIIVCEKLLAEHIEKLSA
jgi:hypothetical protein